MRRPIAIFGAGGYAECVAEAAVASGEFEVRYLIVPAGHAKPRGSWRVVEEPEFQSDPDRLTVGVVAIGDSFRRQQAVNAILLTMPTFEFCRIIHPRASISISAHIEPGTVVLAGAVVGPGVRLGRHVLLFSGTVVEHGSELAEFVSTAPGAMLGGDVRIGCRSFIGIGASVAHGLVIGQDVVVGAGAAVVRPADDNVVLGGVPAREMRARSSGEPYLSRPSD